MQESCPITGKDDLTVFQLKDHLVSGVPARETVDIQMDQDHCAWQSQSY